MAQSLPGTTACKSNSDCKSLGDQFVCGTIKGERQSMNFEMDICVEKEYCGQEEVLDGIKLKVSCGLAWYIWTLIVAGVLAVLAIVGFVVYRKKKQSTF